MKGTVLFYNRQRGFGFIAPLPEEVDSDVDWFVHVSGLVNRKSLRADDPVEFDVSERNGKPLAINVRVIESVASANNTAAKGGV